MSTVKGRSGANLSLVHVTSRAVWILILTLTSCRQQLPVWPSPDVSKMPAAVREQVEAAKEKAARAPGSAEAAGEYGMILHSYELLDAALPCYQRAQILDPGSDRWPYYLGLVHEFSHRPAEAAKWFADVAAKRPADVVVRLRLADSLEAAGDADGSAKVLQALSAAGSVPEQVRLRLGRQAETAGKFDEAAKQYQAAVELFPAYKPALLGLSRAHRRLGNLEAAMAAAGRAAAEGPQPSLEDPLANRMLEQNRSVLGHLKRCTVFKSSGRVREAVQECESAVAVDPGSFGAHGHLVGLYAMQSMWDRAREHYEKAVAIDAAVAMLHLDYAGVLVAQGQIRQAIPVLEKSIAANRSVAAAHTMMGQIHAVTGNARRAEAEFREALDLKPTDTTARDGLGTLLAGQRRFAEALPLLAADSPGRGLPALRALAESHKALGHRAEALAAFEGVLAALPFDTPLAEREKVVRQISALGGK